MISFVNTIAVSLKAEQIAGGSLSAWGLRLAVALGVWPLWRYHWCLQNRHRRFSGAVYHRPLHGCHCADIFASKTIVPLAYDSGGVTTSTVTVPVLAALGLGLAVAVPGCRPLLDGFGLIAFASVFPIISVLGYVIVSSWFLRRMKSEKSEEV